MRAWMPREHGLMAWVGLPMAAALGLAPGSLPAIGAVVAGFCAFNAARRQAWPPAAGAAALSVSLGGLAVARAAQPFPLVCALGTAGLLAIGAGLAFRVHPPRTPLLEVAGITALCGLGAGLAVVHGAPVDRSATVGLMLAAWQVTGLWWVRGLLARVLPRRVPWRAGLGVALALAAAATAAGCWYGLLAIPAALLLYPLRMLAHRAPSSPREAARVGLTELGWSAVALTLALLAAR